jgi:hypothetical protein
VFQAVTGAIDARTFAVPDAEHAIHLLVRIRFNLLCTEYGRSCKFLVDRREKGDVALFEKLAGAPKFGVVGGKRRTAVAADEARGVEAGRAIHGSLHQGNSHQCLGAGQKYASRFPPVTVIEFIVVQRVMRLAQCA